jgi:signal peptidase I
MFIIRWLTSRQVRKGSELWSVVKKHYDHQRDVLSAPALIHLQESMLRTRAALHEGPLGQPLQAQLNELEEVAQKWLKPYSNPGLRDNFESLLGTLVLVFAFKSFFATPMEIPTGSAQPTFYGITVEDLRDNLDEPLPTGWDKFKRRWFLGERYYEVIAETDGVFRGFSKPVRQFGIGNLGIGRRVQMRVGETIYTIPWAPESPERHLLPPRDERGRENRRFFRKGEPIIRCAVRSGDRLFVERLTYNFRAPKRGDYFVFQSTGIPEIVQGTHYIKRLVGKGGERIRVGDDRYLYVNGERITSNDSGFEDVMGFDPDEPPRADFYSGYVNGRVWREYGWNPALPIARKFPDGETEFVVRPNHYLGFGDNTMNSSDGRDWGDFPEDKVIGKSFMVMWPFTKRFGW